MLFAKVKQASVQRIVSFFQRMVRLFMTFGKLFKILLRNAKLRITSPPVALGTDFAGQAELEKYGIWPVELCNNT